MITGAFAANFDSFTAAVQGADVKLRDFETGSNKVEMALGRMTNSFTGTKVIQDAMLMTQAIASLEQNAQKMGTTFGLTGPEIQRAGALAEEATTKMRAMGMDVPAAMQKIADDAKAAGTATEGLGARITGLVAAGAAAKAAMSEVIGIGKEWVTASNDQEDATVRLDTALRAQGTYTPQLSKQFADLATQFERTTIFADEVVTSAEAMLVTIGGVLPKEMKAALTASTDLAAGLRIELPQAVAMVSKALEGNTTSLHKAGIEVDKVAFQTQGASAVFDAIAEKMGGQATAQAATFGGAMKGLSNEVNNVEEGLGGFIAAGLQPVIDLFGRLPDSVRTGTVAVGLLGTGAAALAVAVAGVAAAVALALPLLGIAPAVAGAAAVGGLTTAVGFCTAAFLPLAAAIAAVWVAWKIGNTDTVKNTIGEWGLASDALAAKLFRAIAGIDQMTPAAARAALAATQAAEAAQAHAAALGTTADAATKTTAPLRAYVQQLADITAQVGALSTAQVAEVLAAKALGQTDEQLFKTFGLGHAALELITKGHEAAAAAIKKSTTEAAAASEKLASALDELKSSGEGWKGTLAAIDPILANQIKLYLAAGVSQAALVTVYGLTVTQVKAVASGITDEAAALKLEQAAVAETTKLWNEYHALRAQHGSTATDQQIADVHRWAADLTAQMVKAGTATTGFYAQLAQTTAEKLRGIAVDWSAINGEMTTHSKAGLQQIADKAAATFEEAKTHVADWGDAVVQRFRDTATAAQIAADQWGTAFGGALAAVDAKVAASTLSWSSAMDLVRQGLGTMSGTVINADLTDAGKASTQAAWDRGAYYGPVVGGNQQNPHGTGPDWVKLGYKATGGPVEAGGAYIVGEERAELFVPRTSGTILPTAGGAGAVFNLVFNIIDTEANIARRVSDHLMRAVLAGTRLSSA